MTDNNKTIDNMLVRRFAKLLKNNNQNTTVPIVTGTVAQKNNQTLVTVDGDVSVPISETNVGVNVGDDVTVAYSNDKAFIIGNNSNKSPTTTELEQTSEDLTQKAEDASKVATNYINYDEENGLVVGNMQSETLQGNTQITSEGMNIREGSTVLASFKANEIQLAKNDKNAIIKMCGEAFTINSTYEEKKSGLNTNHISHVEFQDWFGDSVISFTANSQTGSGLSVRNTTINLDADYIYANSGTIKAYGIQKQNYIPSSTSKVYGEVLGEITLFTSKSGSTDTTIALKYSCTEFTYLDVYFTDASGAKGSQRIYNPQKSDSFTLSSLDISSSSMNVKTFELTSTTELQIAEAGGQERAGVISLSDGTFTEDATSILVTCIVGVD